MKSCEIAIVGAGASGLMAACQAGRLLKRRGKAGGVILLDGNPRPGKKLLATGNGRCNLTNLRISPERYHGDKLAEKVLEQYPPQKILGEFERMGLLCGADGEGRVYPNGFQAAAVLQALWSSCEEAGVETAWGFETLSVVPEKGGFLLKAGDGRELWAKKCILACGGMASPKHSCGEKGYRLAKALGHSVTLLSPSLVPLKTDSKSCKALKGMRCRAVAALYRNGEKQYEESGEVIFGENQLSGICVFDLSARLGEDRAGTEIGLDLMSAYSPREAAGYLRQLQKDRPGLPAGDLFSGALNLRVGQELVKILGIPREKPLSALTEKELERAVRLVKDWRFPVTGRGSWESAQVTAGGVPLSEIDLESAESKKRPGLYLTGELLDVDGDCGGYNLHWAWATGMAAGRAAAKGKQLPKAGKMVC